MRKFIGILAALIVGSFFVVGLVGTGQAFPGEQGKLPSVSKVLMLLCEDLRIDVEA